MPDYARTYIKRLSVRGYRSLRSLELDNLPPLIVLFGRNGAGKSNILKAIQLVIRAVSAATMRNMMAKPVQLDLDRADKELELRQEDFARGQPPEIRIAMDVSLGKKARDTLSAPGDVPTELLSLEAVFRDTRDGFITFSIERADIDERFAIPPERPAAKSARSAYDALSEEFRKLSEELATHYARSEVIDDLLKKYEHAHEQGISTPHRKAIEEEITLKGLIAKGTQRVEALQNEMRRLVEQINRDNLFSNLAQRALIPSLLNVSDAYRSPASSQTILEKLNSALLSDVESERLAAAGLGRVLGAARLFESNEPIEVQPMVTKFGEKTIRLKHPKLGGVSIRSLGTGEQQLVLLLAEQAATPAPIRLIEEPEAHLHIALMQPLARALTASVAGDGHAPDIDQLWIATHHHLFALAEEFFEVTQDPQGFTQVERKPRAKAAVHFYEPGPLWGALQSFIAAGLDKSKVLFHYKDRPVTVAEVEESERGDRELFNAWATFASEQLVASMIVKGEKK